ncbi:MAG: tryptophan synthase subunit alpha [Spirochaetales bacterium]|nr:tryptophan synthase subunit alpha [Spirochaetales bacterium]
MTELNTKAGTKLITHFIAGYPDIESSYETAVGLINGGAYALEMQIPFSDPSADGPVIELACRRALEKGFKVSDGFRLIERIKEYRDIPVYLMSYSGIVYNMGIDRFTAKAAAAGVCGLIIPDLIPGADEGLYAAGRKAGIQIVPVVVPGVPDSRLEEIMAENPDWVYLALRAGITGSYTILDEVNLGFLDKVKTYGVKIMAGFGIKTPQQIKTLIPHCDAAIAGSFIVDRITSSYNDAAGRISVTEAAADAVRYLLG